MEADADVKTNGLDWGSGFHYGVDYPDTVDDYSQVNQFAQTPQCGGPFGANSTYCDTILT